MSANDAAVLTAIAAVAYTIVTLGLFVFALFQNDYNAWRNRPILEVVYKKADCQKSKVKTPLDETDIQSQLAEVDRQHEKKRQDVINRGRVQPPFSEARKKLDELFEHERMRRLKRARLEAELPVDTHYFRLRVRNTGRGRAKMVEVFAAELTRQQDDGSFQKVDKFLPQNLLWTHINQPLYPVLSRDMEKNFDLGFVQDPSKTIFGGQPLARHSKHRGKFQFQRTSTNVHFEPRYYCGDI